MDSLFPLLLAFQMAHSIPPGVYHGRLHQLAVQVPRIEAEVAIDGDLSEAAWQQAAILTGFSQYAPNDGVPAVDSTEVLVWYAPGAIYFGIRAFEPHGQVHATLAQRDRIYADDNIQLVLGTFNDGRQATFFMVNPLGVQADGTLLETGTAGSSGMGGAAPSREYPDLSQDFVFQSKGRLTSWGYEVEIRIPFKSLRYPPGGTQTWGINVIRQVQHSGYEDSWTPARQSSSSFLGQSGTLTGLRDLHRGLVLDLNPEATGRVNGVPGPGRWDYGSFKPDIGGNVRWGITNNLTLNGTANPDFSQVETDAGQATFDPRQALFFPEKRPFFLDGLEQFNTPNQLIYTRRIVQPVMAVKLAGKAVGTNIGLLSAIDGQDASFTGQNNPVYNLLRVQRDLGAGSRLGLVYTDKEDGGDYNRVLGVDSRLVFGRIYSAQFQLAGSRTRGLGNTLGGPLWMARVVRQGRTFGFRYLVAGVDPDFRASSGFIGRGNLGHANLTHSVTAYGRPGALVEQVIGDVQLDGLWKYDDMVHGATPLERKLHFNLNSSLRGGWNAGASVLVETFGYDRDIYRSYALEVPGPGGVGLDTIPFNGRQDIRNLDWVARVNTPEFQHFSANAFALWGHDENFFEWASGALWLVNLGFLWRPTDQMRMEGSYQWQQVNRRTDGSRVDVQQIPRLKLEYQVSRPFFVRLVGEYAIHRTDALRDESRTGAPILIFDPEVGDYVRTTPTSADHFRGDLLLAYQPNPGTVVYAGYGSTLQDPNPQGIAGLHRTDDGFFVKMSYLFRM